MKFYTFDGEAEVELGMTAAVCMGPRRNRSGKIIDWAEERDGRMRLTIRDAVNGQRFTTLAANCRVKPAAPPVDPANLTPDQAQVITRQGVEFGSVAPMEAMQKAFPSVTFTRRGRNGDYQVYDLTGPRVWVTKIIRKFANSLDALTASVLGVDRFQI